jgi:hypothetical protein
MKDKTHAAVPGDDDGGLGFGWVHGRVEKVDEFGLLKTEREREVTLMREMAMAVAWQQGEQGNVEKMV